MSGEFGDRRVLEDQVRGKLHSEPFFELDDQSYRICRIEAEPGEFDIRIDRFLGQPERACEVVDAPDADRGFARPSRSQKLTL